MFICLYCLCQCRTRGGEGIIRTVICYNYEMLRGKEEDRKKTRMIEGKQERNENEKKCREIERKKRTVKKG